VRLRYHLLSLAKMNAEQTQNVTSVKFVCEDGEFEFPSKYIEYLKTIQNMINDVSELGDNQSENIPLPDISVSALETIVDFFKNREEHGSPVNHCATPDLSKPILDCDIKFIGKKPMSEVINVLIAANYLNCEQVLTQCCYTIARFIENNSLSVIRREFGIKCDFTPKEWEELMEKFGSLLSEEDSKYDCENSSHLVHKDSKYYTLDGECYCEECGFVAIGAPAATT
jgi:SCF ubiquitin ligase, SKP1 component